MKNDSRYIKYPENTNLERPPPKKNSDYLGLGQKQGLTIKGQGDLTGVIEIFEIRITVTDPQLGTFTKNHQITHLKWG